MQNHLDYLAFAALTTAAFAFMQWAMWKKQARIRREVWLLLAVILGLGWWPVTEAGNAERERIKGMVGGLAPTYAKILEKMGHARVGPETPADDFGYLAMIEMVKLWLQANPAAHDIYTMRKLPTGKNVFIVDSETDYNRDGRFEGEVEQRTAIGEEYGEADEGLERAFRGEANFDAAPVTDRWGTWISSWVPLHDAAGRVEGVLGVDFSAREFLNGVAAARWSRIAQLAVVLILLGSAVCVNGLLVADIEKRQRTEEELRHSKGRLALRAEQTPLAVIEWDLDLRVTDWNAAAERLFGCPRAEAIGRTMAELITPEAVRESITLLRDGRPPSEEPPSAAHTTIDGREIQCVWFNAPLVDGGRIVGVTSLCEDVTERRKLEDQLRQAQKMEAFGQLAGGIAHDFNNMLCVIQGFTDLLRQRRDLPSEVIADLDQVAASAERASDLTRQLLTFSRRQVFAPKNLNLNSVVEQVTTMLRGVLGDDIDLAENLVPSLPEVRADIGMLEQALVNLTVNARDAMTRGGRLVVSTSSRFVDAEEAARHESVQPGPYVCLEVADSGCGIAPEHLPRIFDPFFTTKEVGRGTGLGLATVYGILRQHNGWIEVESERGRGTTFTIFLPAVTVAENVATAVSEPVPLRGGDETILVVEDEIPVREFVTRMLVDSGYRVLTAGTGTEALDVWRRNRDCIDLLFTDMIMPEGISGADLARQLRKEQHDLKILYTSGYSTDFVSRKVDLLPGMNFLQKPYASQQLIRAVRENLDRNEVVGRC